MRKHILVNDEPGGPHIIYEDYDRVLIEGAVYTNILAKSILYLLGDIWGRALANDIQEIGCIERCRESVGI
jgi:hypothetical protein